MHYIPGSSHQHEDNDDHTNLPLKHLSESNAFIFMKFISQLEPPAETDRNFFSFEVNFYYKDFPNSIFHPPSC
jgi:hypothetical protein